MIRSEINEKIEQLKIQIKQEYTTPIRSDKYWNLLVSIKDKYDKLVRILEEELNRVEVKNISEYGKLQMKLFEQAQIIEKLKK